MDSAWILTKGQIVSLLNIKMEPDGRFPSLYKMDFFVRPGRIITVTVLQDPHISLLTEWTKTESILAFSIMETVEQMLCFLSLVTDQGAKILGNKGTWTFPTAFPLEFLAIADSRFNAFCEWTTNITAYSNTSVTWTSQSTSSPGKYSVNPIFIAIGL